MGRVYQSVEEYAEDRVKDIEERTEKKWGIWGTADYAVSILESGEPALSGSGAIRRSGVTDLFTMAYGHKDGRYYKLGYDQEYGFYDFLGRINDATLDEIYLIIGMATPEIINHQSFQNTIMGRLAVLEKTVGKEKIDTAKQRVEKVFDCMKDAVKVDDNTYYPAGYVPEKHNEF